MVSSLSFNPTEKPTDVNHPVSDQVAGESVPVSKQVAGESVEKHGTKPVSDKVVGESVPVSEQVTGGPVKKHGTKPVSNEVVGQSVPVSEQVTGGPVEKNGTKPVSNEVVGESVPVSEQVAGESVDKNGTKPVSNEVVGESVPVSDQVAGESVGTKPVPDEVIGESVSNHGTKLMGPPAPPATHPHNQQAAAVWGPHRGDDESPYMPPQNGNRESPYVERSPVQKPSGTPMESILDAFNSWSKKADTLSSNVWDHLSRANSKTDAAWGKLQLTAKAITGGGFEHLFRQTFDNEPSERLKKSFACYLSTSTGPVAGTLYLSNVKIAFCSDRPLSFTAPSGQESWSYYKAVVPLTKVAAVNPVIQTPTGKSPTPARESPAPEKYVQVETVDGHEFWFMGFVNYDKAGKHLSDAVSDYTAAGKGVAPAAAAGKGVAPSAAAGKGVAPAAAAGKGVAPSAAGKGVAPAAADKGVAPAAGKGVAPAAADKGVAPVAADKGVAPVVAAE